MVMLEWDVGDGVIVGDDVTGLFDDVGGQFLNGVAGRLLGQLFNVAG